MWGHWTPFKWDFGSGVMVFGTVDYGVDAVELMRCFNAGRAYGTVGKRFDWRIMQGKVYQISYGK